VGGGTGEGAGGLKGEGTIASASKARLLGGNCRRSVPIFADPWLYAKTWNDTVGPTQTQTYTYVKCGTIPLN
jgi:hypothetical protein